MGRSGGRRCWEALLGDASPGEWVWAWRAILIGVDEEEGRQTSDQVEFPVWLVPLAPQRQASLPPKPLLPPSVS